MGKIGVAIGSITAIPLAFYGFAFLKACMSASGIPAGVVFDGALIPNFRSTVNAAFALVLAFSVYRLGSPAIRKAGLGIGTGCYLVALFTMTAAYFDSSQSLNSALSIASTLAQSAGTVVLSSLWIDLYARLNPTRAIFANSCAIIAAQCIVYLTELNPVPRILFMLMVSIIASTACCRFAKIEMQDKQNRTAKTIDTATESKKGRATEYCPIPLKALLFIAIYSLAYGVATPIIDVISARYAAVIPSAIVIVLVIVNSRRFSVATLFRIALPLMIGGFLLVAVIPGHDSAVSTVVLNAGYSAMELLLVLMVCTISYGTNASAIWLFSLLAATQFGMRAIGSCIGTFISELNAPFATTTVSIAMLVLIAMITLSLMSEKNLFLFWKAENKATGQESEEPSDEQRTATRVNGLSAAHGLTDRETEVFHLAMQGKTNIQIANDMFISEGTVKAHLHHIYQKFGISSRKELFALVDGGQGNGKKK